MATYTSPFDSSQKVDEVTYKNLKADFDATQAQKTSTVPVVTANKAQDDLAKKQSYANTIEQGMNQQAVVNSQTKAQADAAAVAKKQADALAAQKQSEIDAKAKLGGSLDSPDNFYNLTSVTPGEQALIKQGYTKEQIETLRKDPNAFRFSPTDDRGVPLTNIGTADTSIANQEKDLATKYEEAFTQYKTDVESLRNGTFPLSASDQANINAVQASFDRLKQQQIQANQNYEQGLKQLGVTSGRARYAGEIEMGNIQKAVSDGISKVAGIEQDASKAINNLKSAFEDRDYKRINDSYDKLTASLDAKSKALEDMQKAINDEADNMVKQAKARQDELEAKQKLQKDTISGLSTLAFKSLTGDAESDAKLISDMAKQYDLDPTMLLSAVYDKQTEDDKANKATGDVGQWLSAVANGAVPEGTSYSQFLKLQEEAKTNPLDLINKQLDIQQKQQNLATGGLTQAQINSTVNTIAGAFDNEPLVKEYNTIKRQADTFKNLGSSATDDIQRVYTFAKIADPTSAVKEGEYKSIEKYAQALLERQGLSVKRVFTATGILTPEAREAMSNTIETSLTASEKAYKNVATEYQRQINDAYSGKPRQITDYSNTTEATPTGETLDSFVEQNPDIATPQLISQLEQLHPDWGEQPDKILEFFQRVKNATSSQVKTNDLSMSVKGSTKVLDKVVAKPNGTTGGQCGHFVNQLTGLGVGDSYQSKLAKMDNSIKTPSAGMVFVMPTNGATSENGHVGIILAINNGIATVKDSNWKGDEKVSTHKIPISKMTGFKQIT